jgi:hypothetical protein
MAPKTISDEIEARRKQLAQQRRIWEDLGHQIEIAEAELRGLELAASLMPPWASHVGSGKEDAEKKSTEAHAGGKGRQTGAISQSWRGVFRLMDQRYPQGADRREIASLGPEVGLKNLDPRQVTPQMKRYISQAYIIEQDGKYLITNTARERFGLNDLNGSKPSTGFTENHEAYA